MSLLLRAMTGDSQLNPISRANPAGIRAALMVFRNDSSCDKTLDKEHPKGLKHGCLASATARHGPTGKVRKEPGWTLPVLYMRRYLVYYSKSNR